jgi:uncharacterized protein (UPF0333 family)
MKQVPVAQARSEQESRRSRRRAQVSFEYLLIIGFSFLLFIPLTALYLTTQGDVREGIAAGQTTRVAETLRDAAERVYVAGESARETLTIKLPEGIDSAQLDNTTILFTVHSRDGDFTIAASGFAPLTGTLPITKGTHTIVVTATTSGVVFS